jgi:hypothetical protein
VSRDIDVRRALGAIVLGALLCAAPSARAASDRLALGTHDAALASALSVAVSPRGLSVIELPEPLHSPDDVHVARREIAVAGTVAVVWLCDDARFGNALCFCGGDGRLVVRPLSVSAPLDPPAAAAVALTVKMLLGPPPPPAPRVVAEPPAPAAPVAEPPRPTFPSLVVSLDVGARYQPVSAGPFGLRLTLGAVLSPERWGGRWGLGARVGAGQALAVGDGRQPAGRTLNDVVFGLHARGRLAVGRPWLELDLGPSVHLLSVADGAAASSRAEVSLDASVGAILPLPVARMLLGVRVGGFGVLTTHVTAEPALPRGNAELMLTLGRAIR